MNRTIIATVILAAFLVASAFARSVHNRVTSEIRALSVALESYKTDHGHIPPMPGLPKSSTLGLHLIRLYTSQHHISFIASYPATQTEIPQPRVLTTRSAILSFPPECCAHSVRPAPHISPTNGATASATQRPRQHSQTILPAATTPHSISGQPAAAQLRKTEQNGGATGNSQWA